MAKTQGHGEFGSTGFTHSKSAKVQRVKPSTFQDLACTVMNLHVLRSVQPAPLTRGKKTELCWSIQILALAASYVLGHVHMGLGSRMRPTEL